jgi:signal transduction histidine kinase
LWKFYRYYCNKCQSEYQGSASDNVDHIVS